MTVADLIAALQEMPQEARVAMRGWGSLYDTYLVEPRLSVGRCRGDIQPDDVPESCVAVRDDRNGKRTIIVIE